MTDFAFPDPPEVPEAQRGSGKTSMRFEDVAQDGRMRLEGIWPPIGPILWGKMDVAHALLRLSEHGIRAVLSYVLLEGGSEPLSVRARSEHEVRWRVGHTLDDAGELNRIVFDTWLVSRAPRGTPGNPGLDPTSSESVLVARAYGQHVFTRPAAPAGKHRVLAVEDELIPDPRGERVTFRNPAALLALPPGVVALDEVPRVDSAPMVFGLCHTDGNQHVNFLAYPRLAEEASLRRFAEHGLDPRRLARRAAVGYRKPSFAGDRVRVVSQAYREGETLGLVAAFVSESELGDGRFASFADVPKPRCTVRLEFPG